MSGDKREKTKERTPPQLNLFKRWHKNEVSFLMRLFMDWKFRRGLRSLLRRYGDSRLSSDNFIADLAADYTNPSLRLERFKARNTAHEESLKVVENWDRRKQIKFSEDINRFLWMFLPGSEWCLTLITLIISGRLYPPVYNLHIDISRWGRHTRKSTIILNPDTSIDDVRDAWGLIKIIQNDLCPNFRKRNIVNYPFRDLIDFWIVRNKVKPGTKYENLSPYENMIRRAGYSMKYIRGIREKSGKERGVSGPIRLKRSGTYQELAKYHGAKTAKEIRRVINRFKKRKQRMFGR